MANKGVLLFYSYAHEDEALRKQLDNHLQSLVREGLIYPWHDREIRGGIQWAREIDTHLQSAHIILLLISPAFIASDYCYGIEMAEAVRREKKGRVRVIPIILRPCRWEGIPFLKELQALPKDAKPVTTWPGRDEVLAEITREVASIATELRSSIDISDTIQTKTADEGQQQAEEGDQSDLPRFGIALPGNYFASRAQARTSRLAALIRSPYIIPCRLHIPAIYSTRILSTIVTTLCIDVIANGIGFRAWGPTTLFDLVRLHPTLSILLSCFFILVGIVAWIIAGAPKELKRDQEKTSSSALALSRRLVISTVLSTTSSFLCLTLLAIIMLRPPWCPAVLCLPPRPVLNPMGNNDGTLEVYFTTLQSTTYVIPGNPLSYNLAHLPDQIGALRIDQKVQAPYRVVFGVHSLQHGSYGMFIDQVSLVVDDTPSSPYPLKVWYKSAPLEYKSAPFRVTYAGEPVGTVLNSTYVPSPGAHAQLIPGESDEIDLEVVSQITVDLRFHIQVTYRVTNENEIHTLTLPGSFEVVFSNAANWHQYQLADGHLVPR